MAITDEKKDLLLGKDSETLINNADENFNSLFDTVDDLNDAITTITKSGYITKDVNNLTNYTVATETGTDIELSLDTTNYQMTLKLKNLKGDVVSTQTIDFPLESVVVSASYADGKITLTLQNGTTTEVDVSALVSGLVPDTRKVNDKALSEDITLTQDDVGDGTTYQRFAKTDKETLDGIPNTYAKKTDLEGLATTGQVGGLSQTIENTYAKKTDLHSHDNKAVIDKFTEVGGNLKYNGNPVGAVQDVKVNGTTVVADGVANIDLDSISVDAKPLEATYDDTVTLQAVTFNDKSYKAIVIPEGNVTLEVLNSDGKAVVTQVVRANGNIYYCLPSNDEGTYTLRKVGGNAVSGGGGSKRYLHWITFFADGQFEVENSENFNSVKFAEYQLEVPARIIVNENSNQIIDINEALSSSINIRAGKVMLTSKSNENYFGTIRAMSVINTTQQIYVAFYSDMLGEEGYFFVNRGSFNIIDTVIEV